MSDTPPKQLKKASKYYLSGGDLFLLAGETVFRVHSHFFIRESAEFRAWLEKPGPLGQAGPGKTVDTAIVLENVEPQELEKFLWCFYNPKYSLYDATADTWEIILRLAHHWGFAQIKELAIRELEKKDIPTVDRIILYQQYNIPRSYIAPLYADLCASEYPLSMSECLKLGIRATAVIFQTRERLRADPNNGGKSPLREERKGDVLGLVQEILDTLPPPSPSPGLGGTPNGH